ncbi:MAG TPA: hypothetical protein VFI23_03700 [Rhizomicrobium sp.]|nr:hypothetical protein [Rhizomicrobium sp.]
MKQFELRFLDGSDVVVWMRAYSGNDKGAALGEAKKLSATHTIEVWEGDHKVVRVKRTNVMPIRDEQPQD